MKIILVFKTHFDIGFTDLASNVIDQYAGSMLEQVIETCKGTQKLGKRHFVWTMPAWPLWHIVNHSEPSLKKELDELIENGQVVWHALPFTSHTDFATPGEYMRGFTYSRLLAERYRKPCPIAAKMTDVPGHSVMLPDLLSQAGIRFLHLGCNEFATPPEVPELFYWQAPGGRKVLTMYSRGGYGSGLIPPKSWKYPVWMALMHTVDNSGPQSADAIEHMVEEIQKTYPEAEIVCGTMDDFYRELEKCDLSEVPVLQKDMADTWIHGVGAYPKEVGILREDRKMAETMEAIWANQLLVDTPAETAKEEKICKLWDAYYHQITMFEEHTWGADVKTYMGPNRVYKKEEFREAKDSDAYRFMERSWEEQRERVQESHKTAGELCAELIAQNGGEKQKEWYLFYQGSGTYTGWVELPEGWEHPVVTRNGEKLPCEKIAGIWQVYVERLDGFRSVPVRIEEECGGCCSKAEKSNTETEEKADRYNTECVEKGEKAENSKDSAEIAADGTACLENHRYSIWYNANTGKVLRVHDKKAGKDLLTAKESEGIFSYQYDRYGYDDINEYLRTYGYHFTTWGIQDYGRENYPFCEHETCRPAYTGYERKEHGLVLHYTGGKSADEYGDARKMQIEIALPEQGEEIFVTLHLENKQESPYVEAGSFVVPFAGEYAEYRIRKGGVTLDPATDIVEKANHSLYCLDEGVAVLNGQMGLWVQSLDAPLMAVGDPGIYTYGPVFDQAKKPVLYFNLFNNMWGTNFPQWTGGDFTFRFRLQGFATESGEVVLPAECLEHTGGVAVMDAPLPETDLKFPTHMKLIGAERLDANRRIFTFLELEGKEEREMIRAKGWKITECDLSGKPTEAGYENLRGDICVFTSVAYGTSSFLFVRQDEKEKESEEKVRSLAEKYLPVLQMDEKEPFGIVGVGYTLYENAKRSASCTRMIDPVQYGAEYCIEYAYYYDYDIQHLYDLEHIWVYVDNQGAVCECEHSFHGKFFHVSATSGELQLKEGRPVFYVQPGKHALMPQAKGSEALVDYRDACGAAAGADGILTPDIIPGMPVHTPWQDQTVENYIKEHFAFVPAGTYIKWDDKTVLLPWPELCAQIPERVEHEMRKIVVSE